jgi:hypothetical protein
VEAKVLVVAKDAAKVLVVEARGETLLPILIGRVKLVIALEKVEVITLQKNNDFIKILKILIDIIGNKFM